MLTTTVSDDVRASVAEIQAAKERLGEALGEDEIPEDEEPVRCVFCGEEISPYDDEADRENGCCADPACVKAMAEERGEEARFDRGFHGE